MAGNEYDALIAESPEAQAKAVTNEYDALVVDFTKERSQRTRASIYSAQDANPDQTAKAITLSKKTGIPVDTVERDVKAVEGPATLNEYDALVQKSPGLGKWLEDPINARVAKDDYENLGLLEKGWNEIKRGFLGQRGDVQALGASVAGQRGADLTAALEKAQRGEYLTPIERAMVAQAPEARANVDAASTTAIGKLLENKKAADAIPMRPATRELNEAKTWGEAWSALGKDPLGIIFDLTTGNLPQLLTSTAATVIGGPAVGVAAMGGQSFAMEFVSGILDNMQELGVNTGDPEALRSAFANPDLMAQVYRKSTIKASIVGTLDAATMGIAGKTLAPAAVKGRLAREAVNMPAQLATQMVGGAGGEALGSVAAGNEVKPGAVLAEAVAELGSAPAEVLAMRNHFGKVKRPSSPEQIHAEGQAAGLDKLVADAQGTKLAGRSPDKLTEFLSTVTGPDQNVFVPVEAVQAYFQSKPVEDMQAMADALGITDQIPEALATGGDVVIPLAKYVTEAGKSDIHKAWREDVRLEADGFSIRQAQEDAKVREERLKLAVDRFEKQLEAGIAEVDATTRVYEDLRDKLKTAGKFTNEAAEQQAAVFAEHYATRAARNPGSYLDAWDAYSKAGLGAGMEIRTQLSDRVGAYPPDDLDVLLNSIKTGKVAPTKDADANAQFLKDREELAGAFSDLKLDPKKLSNAQIRAAIKAEVEKRKAGGNTYEQPVYHGTPHIFGKFDLDRIGTGEGAQAYGWGLYFAGNKAVAEWYRENLSASADVVILNGERHEHTNNGWMTEGGDALEYDSPEAAALDAFRDAGGNVSRAVSQLRQSDEPDAADAINILLENDFKMGAAGRLYHVEIPDDGAYLHWDKPLNEQSPEVWDKLDDYSRDRETHTKDVMAQMLDDARDKSHPNYEMTGSDFYDGLVAVLGEDQKAASLILREAGIPGIQYLDGSSRGKGEGAFNYVLFDDSLTEIKSYEQEARGQITFADNLSTITLFQGRDLSTLLHETGHLWLEELGFDAKAATATPQIKADYQAVLDALGSKDGYITREMHEQWAQWAEQYFMEGKAPSAGLASAFRSFKRWLTQIYRRLTALGAPITPEIRQVFDRLIATDEQIEAAQNRQGLNPVFKDAESAGMTKAEFAAYTARANAVVDEAEQKLLQKTMDAIRKQRTKEWKADETRVRDEVRDEVMSESGQQALALLTKGEFPVGTTPEVLKGIKLTKEDIVALYGDETVLTMLPAGIYRDRSSGPGAMSPDELAPMLGLDSGKDLIERLMQLEAQHKAMAAKGDKRSVARAKIDEETAQRMSERYGDPLNDGTIEQEAMAAVHSDKQAALMATELRVLAKKAGHTGTITWDDIKSWAAEAIADKSVREGTKFDQYARAERTAGRKVEQALIKGDFVAAFKAKQDQMVNHALYMEARTAAADVESARKLMDRYAGAATIKNMDQDYLEQIHGLLEDYEFKNRSATLLAERKSFEAWAAEQAANGIEVEPPPRLAKGLGTTNYRDMTVDELRGLADTVKQIAHLGRKKKELLDGEKKREFEAAVAEAVTTAGAQPQRGVSGDDTGLTPLQEKIGKFMSGLRGIDASLLKMESLFEWLDGDKTGRGIFTRIGFRPFAEAQGRERDRVKGLTKNLADIHAKVPQSQRDRWLDIHTIAALPKPNGSTKWNKTQIISMALNIGNESNLSKLLEGYQWDEANLRAVLDTQLTKEEWQFVQDVWDLIETQWPDLSAVHRRVNGVEPPKIERIPIPTPFGPLAGGYYKVDYDRNLSIKAEAVGERAETAAAVGQIFPSGMTRPTTRAGATHKRTGFVAPIRLSMDLISQQLVDAAHDIEFREAVLNAHKFFRDERVRQSIREAVGPEYERMIAPWLQNIAHEWQIDRQGLNEVQKFASVLRTNVTMVGLGFRISTMLAQTAGYANSVQRLGPVAMADGLKTFALSPIQQTEWVREKSSEMRHRSNDLERDIRAAQLKMQGKTGMVNAVRRLAFQGIAFMDAAVSVPTWLGAYSKGLKDGMADQDAVYFADKMVRDTQGAGAAKDMAAIQRGGPILKLFTMFYSYFNVLYNRQRGIVRDAREGHWGSAINQTMFLMVVAPLLGQFLTGQGPDDDEEWAAWAARNALFGVFTGIPWVRDIANAGSAAVGGKNFGGAKLSPVQSFGDNLIHLFKDFNKMAAGEDTSPSALKNAFNVAGVVTALPLGQVGQTSQFLWDALVAGSQDPESIKDWLSGLAYGPERRK